MLEKCNINIKKVKTDLTVVIDEEKEKIVMQEGHSRRRNIIINGKEQTEGENTQEVVKNFLINDMHFSAEEVAEFLFRDVHRLPKAKKRDGTVHEEAKKPIIVAFLKQKDRNSVMRKAYKLKDSDYSIKTDLPKALNEVRGLMLKERKRLKAIDPEGRYRVGEKGYKPVLQKCVGLIPHTTKPNWVDIKFKPAPVIEDAAAQEEDLYS